MGYEAAERAATAAAGLQSATERRADHMSSVLRRTARALELSAALAEAHADRRERAGHVDEAVREREMAGRATAAAQRARVRAEELRGLRGAPEPSRSPR